MPLYAVQMAGVNWNTGQELDAPVVVEAADGEDAIQRAMSRAHMRRRVTSEVVILNVARLGMFGTGSWSMDSGREPRVAFQAEEDESVYWQHRDHRDQDMVDQHGLLVPDLDDQPTGKRDIRL